MKIFALIFLFGLISSQTDALKERQTIINVVSDVVAKAVGDKLKDLIESFKEILRNGNETMGIPVLDPFNITEKNMTLDYENSQAQMHINNTIVSGLSNYNINKADFKIVGSKLGVSLEWPEIKGNLKAYNLFGKLINFVNIYGSGDAEINLKNLEFSIDISFGMNSTTKTLLIKSIETEYYFGYFEFYTEGLYNDKDISQLFSALISDLLPQIIERQHDQVLTIINETVTNKANEFLSTMTLSDLLGLLS